MRYIVLFTFLSCIMSCRYSDEFNKIRVDDRAVLYIPPYMEKTDDISDDAVIQYKNSYRNCYVIVLKKPVVEGIRDYQAGAIETILSYLDNPIITDSAVTEVNGLKAYYNSIFGKIGEELVYYEHMTVELRDYYYEICSWTRGPDRKDRYGDDLLRILNSFHGEVKSASASTVKSYKTG